MSSTGPRGRGDAASAARRSRRRRRRRAHPVCCRRTGHGPRKQDGRLGNRGAPCSSYGRPRKAKNFAFRCCPYDEYRQLRAAKRGNFLIGRLMPIVVGNGRHRRPMPLRGRFPPFQRDNQQSDHHPITHETTTNRNASQLTEKRRVLVRVGACW